MGYGRGPQLDKLVSTIPINTSTGTPMQVGFCPASVSLVTSGWNAAGLSFEASIDGGTTWLPILSETDAVALEVPAAGMGTAPSALIGTSYMLAAMQAFTLIRPRSGIPGTYVNQAAARTLTFILKS